MMNFIKRIISFIFGSNCYYVSNLEKLLPPLKKEEEYNCLIKAKKGDEEAKNTLILHNLRLVVFIAKKYQNNQYDLEDLVSIGTIGLIKGINTYKIDKNIRLATYSSRCIANEILMFLRKNKKTINEVSLDDIINYDSEGNAMQLVDVLKTDDDVVLEEFLKSNNAEVLQKKKEKLDDREKQIMTMRYGLYNTKEYTQKEVADRLNISQSYISRIEKKIIRRIKYLLKV